ncbi:aspartate 1-decarboxylase [Candidatus Pacearchaeota archaeon]|nr:aspartate 1-decarboxylase [Candidatus Pacearchaeota archaeon]
MKEFLSSKIHKARVTEANVNYEGSITIDLDLMTKSGILAGQKVLVVSNSTGARLETYVIAGASNSGIICMNGASAHLIKEGEEIIIMGFEIADKPCEVKSILVDDNNKFVKYL